jgi:hypothetical protein
MSRGAPATKTATHALPSEPTTATNSDYALARVHGPFEEIQRGQSDLDEHNTAAAALKEKKATQLAALDTRIANLKANYTGFETDTFVDLVNSQLAREQAVQILDELLPAPMLDPALEGRMGNAFYEFVEAERDVLRRVYDGLHQQALSKLAQTLGDDATRDAEGIDRGAIASASPDCRRVESMIMERQGFSRIGFKLDLRTDYRGVYRQRLDELEREIEKVGELPPAKDYPPDEPHKPVIVDRGQWPADLPPNGWSVRRELNS